MARATRESTRETLATLRAQHPLALGPYLGDLATTLNVSASLVSEMIGTHEQTIFRWFFHRTPVHPRWMLKVAKAIAVLYWMHEAEWPALDGDMVQRKKQLSAAIRTYTALTRRG